ncbi:SAM-dependent methyltransferase [Nostoc sp. T09]|nr:SAM-dependent methyltransferase [Nostoc sp. T09]
MLTLQNFTSLNNKVLSKVNPLILGKHPENTIFSFNYQNVSHINKFIKASRQNFFGTEHILIDIGSGNSPYYPIFSDIVREYIAIDTADSLPKSEARPIRQIVGFAEELPLQNSFADIVLCNQVLEHVNDPIKAVSEMYRILKPGSLCIGSVPHISPVHLEPYDFRRYTDLGLESLLKDAGFIDIKIEGNGGVYSAAALMIAMDWMLTSRKEGKPQGFSASRALLLSPIVGLMNVAGLILDMMLGNKNRTPANLCWTATKPLN